jgi:hypothetical protein
MPFWQQAGYCFNLKVLSGLRVFVELRSTKTRKPDKTTDKFHEEFVYADPKRARTESQKHYRTR